MPEQIKQFFANKPISPHKRTLGPVISAVVSFFLPGSAQTMNGQLVKGISIMLAWLCTYTLAGLSPALYSVIRILQYAIMVVVSSDAYFISSRMRMGEEVRAWSVLFFNIKAPVEGGVREKQRKTANRRTLITDVTVIDGTGAPAFQADVLIEGGTIGCIRPHLLRKEKEYTIVEGKDRILVPGFLNPCCCSEASVFGSEENTLAVRQGITTEVLGANGQSLAPVGTSGRDEAGARFAAVHGGQEKAISFDNTGLYLLDLERQKYPARTESMMGYGTLRATVLGNYIGTPDSQELQQVCSRIRSGLTSGAKGVSLGLAYPPCSFLEDEELRAVFQTTAEGGGLVSAQLPLGEGQLLPGLKRLGALVRETGVQLMVTCLHAAGADRQLADEVCRLVGDLRGDGADLTLAVTGLDRQYIGLIALTPGELWAEGGAAGRRELVLEETARRLAAAGGPAAVSIEGEHGQLVTLERAAQERGCAPEELILTLLEENDGAVSALLDTDDEAFMSRLLREPYTFVCTDSRKLGPADFTIPYFLGRYVKDLGVLTMEQAVHRNTMIQAARLRMWDRGLIREGMSADLVLLRPELLPGRLGDGATRGVSKVWVRGALEYDTESTAALNHLRSPKFFGIGMGE